MTAANPITVRMSMSGSTECTPSYLYHRSSLNPAQEARLVHRTRYLTMAPHSGQRASPASG
jgi:hypothetical protein